MIFWISSSAFNISLSSDYHLFGGDINLKVKCFHKKGDYPLFHVLNKSLAGFIVCQFLLYIAHMQRNGSLNYITICLQGRYVTMNRSCQIGTLLCL